MTYLPPRAALSRSVTAQRCAPSDRDAVVKLFKGFVNRVWLTDRDRRAAFDAISTHKTISFEELQLVLETVVPFDAKTSPPKQAVITLWRNYAKAGKLHVQDLPF